MPRPLPKFFLPMNDARNFVERFRINKWPRLVEGLGKQETQTIWYSMSHLTELLQELAHLNASGVRVYFSQYPDTFHSPAGNNCGKQLGIVFVATKEVEIAGKKYHRDEFLEEQPDFPQRPVPASFDYGSPCPTDCDGHIPRLP